MAMGDALYDSFRREVLVELRRDRAESIIEFLKRRQSDQVSRYLPMDITSNIARNFLTGVSRPPSCAAAFRGRFAACPP